MKKTNNLKPILYTLIQLWYSSEKNGCGGHYHIVLDDGNLEKHWIQECQENCKKEGDNFGAFLGDLLLSFTYKELKTMYYTDFWGMD